VYPVEDHLNWMEFYADTSEKIPKDLPPEKGPRVRMTVYVDADHAHDLVTRISITGMLVIRRSITGILVMLNNTHIRWISKHQ
jgi:desulfoferrodoxin (superoxide reductase-like protein)